MSAQSSRRVLLAGALICMGLFVAWLLLPLLGNATPGLAEAGMFGTPFTLAGDKTAGIIADNLIFLGVMLLAQWAFLRPIRRTPLIGAEKSRPRWQAIVSVAFVTALLCTAAAATLLEMPNWWKALFTSVGQLWGAMLGLWLGWSVVFFVYFRQGDFLAKAETVVRALIRGSCLELLVAIPTHALVYRRNGDDCYCARGSYTGVVLGSAVLVWAFGPGLVLLYLREKQRREPILQRLCPQCGAVQDPTGTPGSPCLRCGRASG